MNPVNVKEKEPDRKFLKCISSVVHGQRYSKSVYFRRVWSDRNNPFTFNKSNVSKHITRTQIICLPLPGHPKPLFITEFYISPCPFFFFFFNFIICDTVNQDSCFAILGEIKTCYLLAFLCFIWLLSPSFFLTELQFRAWIGCFQKAHTWRQLPFSAGNAHSSRAQRQLCRNISS